MKSIRERYQYFDLLWTFLCDHDENIAYLFQECISVNHYFDKLMTGEITKTEIMDQLEKIYKEIPPDLLTKFEKSL